MARLFDDAQSEFLQNAGALIAAPPMSMACWFNSDDTANYQALMGLGSTTAFDHLIYAAGAAAGDTVWASTRDANAITSTGYSANTWHHAAGVWASTSSRAAYIDGGSKGTNTTLKTGSVNRTSISSILYNGSRYYYMSGRVAEAAMWDVALTDGEVAMLAAGFSPLLVRPQGLVGYWPLGGIYGEHDNTIVGDCHMTAYSTPSWGDHPATLIYPQSGLMIAAAAAAAAAGHPAMKRFGGIPFAALNRGVW